MKIIPLFDRVLLKKEKPKQTDSKIFLPSGMEDKSSLAFVVAMGNGQTENNIKTEMQVKIGQKVLYAKFAGSEIKIEKDDFIVIKQTDILAIIEEEN